MPKFFFYLHENIFSWLLRSLIITEIGSDNGETVQSITHIWVLHNKHMCCSALYLQFERPHRHWTLMSPSIRLDCVIIVLPAFIWMPLHFSYSLQLLQHVLLCCGICGLMNQLKIWLKFHKKQAGYGDVARATGWHFIVYEDSQSDPSSRNQSFDLKMKWMIAGKQCEVKSFIGMFVHSVCLLTQVPLFLSTTAVRTLQLSAIKWGHYSSSPQTPGWR